MSSAALIGVIAGLVIVLAASRAVYGRGGERRGTTASALRWLAGAVTVGLAISFFPTAWDDSGAFAFVLVGVPVLAAALALSAVPAGRATALTWIAAVVMLGWSLITALGLGIYFLVPSLLLFLAAAMSTHRPSTTA